MSEETLKKNKPEESDKILNIMSLIVLLFGLYLIFIAPIFYDITVDTLIAAKTKKALAAGLPMPAGPMSRLYICAIYGGVEMLVGFALVVLAFMIFTYKKWAWPFVMFLISIPTMANGYIGLGWLENLKMFPPAYYTFFLSFIVFMVMIVLKKMDKKAKRSTIGFFLLIGMIGAQGFMLFPHAVRTIMKDPYTFTDPAVAVLRRTGTLMFLSFVFAGLAILKLAQRKESGWYLALLTGLTMAVGAFPAHYARPLVSSLLPADYPGAATIFTSTYWMAGAQGVLLILFVVFRLLKSPKLLVDDMDGELPF